MTPSLGHFIAHPTSRNLVDFFRDGGGHSRRDAGHNNGGPPLHTASGTNRLLIGGGRRDEETPQLEVRAREDAVGCAPHPRRRLRHRRRIRKVMQVTR